MRGVLIVVAALKIIKKSSIKSCKGFWKKGEKKIFWRYFWRVEELFVLLHKSNDNGKIDID